MAKLKIYDTEMKNGMYEVIEQYDAFICNCGRITVNSGTIFEYRDGDVRFPVSQNKLPDRAASIFSRHVKCRRIN